MKSKSELAKNVSIEREFVAVLPKIIDAGPGNVAGLGQRAT